MKKHVILMIALIVAVVAGCLKNEEVPPPVMTISQGENEILNFSTIQSAEVKVHVESGEELKYFQTKTVPMSSWSDTTIVFNPYTYRSDINLSFRIWKGFTVKTQDSIFEVTYTAYTADTSCTLRRKLRYRYVYPELDSFDIEVSSAANGKCLIDVESQKAYPYTEFSNRYYDLVYVNELGGANGENAFGSGLISPHSPYLMRYFQWKVPTLPYDNTNKRTTACGVIADPPDRRLTWEADFNSVLVGDEDNWVQHDRISVLPPQDGIGVTNLLPSTLFKFRLHNGRYMMIKVLSRQYIQYEHSTVNLRIYVQR